MNESDHYTLVLMFLDFVIFLLLFVLALFLIF